MPKGAQEMSRARKFVFRYQHLLRTQVEDQRDVIKTSGRKDKKVALRLFDRIDVDPSVVEYRCRHKRAVMEMIQAARDDDFVLELETLLNNLRLMGRHIYLFLKATATLELHCEDKEWRTLLAEGIKILEARVRREEQDRLKDWRIIDRVESSLPFLTKLLNADISPLLPHS